MRGRMLGRLENIINTKVIMFTKANFLYSKPHPIYEMNN